MQTDLIMQKIADKISRNINCHVLLNSSAGDNCTEDHAGLYFDGIRNDSENLEKNCNFKFRYYSSDDRLPLSVCEKAEILLRTMLPETFTDGNGNEFDFHSCRTESISAGVTNSSGIVWFFAELKFSVIS